MKTQKAAACELCEREVSLTFHHLVPKKMFGKRKVKLIFEAVDLHHHGIWVCADCHKQIHQLFNHEELAFQFNSKSALEQDEGLARFISWVSRQDKKVKR